MSRMSSSARVLWSFTGYPLLQCTYNKYLIKNQFFSVSAELGSTICIASTFDRVVNSKEVCQAYHIFSLRNYPISNLFMEQNAWGPKQGHVIIRVLMRTLPLVKNCEDNPSRAVKTSIHSLICGGTSFHTTLQLVCWLECLSVH